MDPFLGSLVGALAAGAIAAAKGTATQVVKDAYAAIRQYIKDRYEKVPVDHLVEKPESKSRQASLVEDLEESGAAGDAELASRAKQLSDALKHNDKDSAEAVGFDIGTFEAEYAKFIEMDVSSGTAFRADVVKLEKGLDVGKLKVGPKN